MKNIVCVILFSMLFLSCFTSPSPTSNNKLSTSWIFDKNNLEEANLSKNEIVFRDIPDGLPGGAQVELFGKISWFNSLLDILNLHETLSFEDKELLFSGLFGFIPIEPTDDIYRAVAIGKYFSNGSPLILYARAYKPSDKAPNGSKGVLQFTGNFIIVEVKKTGKIEFRPMKGMVMPNFNWFSNGVIFSDNQIVRASYLYSQEGENKIKEEAKDNKYLQYVNLADTYIKDELKDNDDKALEMLTEAYNNTTDLATKVVAQLNTFLYYLYKNDVTSAENILVKATQLSKEMDNIDPSFLQVINIEAPTMLKLYKNNTP